MKSFLVICGSTNRPSKNFLVSEYISKTLNCDIQHFEEELNIPFVTDNLLSKNYFPEELISFFQKILEKELLIFVLPEHNWNFSAFFKNILDWLSIKKIDLYSGKTVVVISASETQREFRFFENIIFHTFAKFGSKKVHFINWNNFDFDDEQKKKEIVQKILEIK